MTADATAAKPDFSKTLNLPVTDFPMRAGLPQREPEMVATWLKNDLYGAMRAKRAGAPKFILHLGPPYANGNFHMGHVLTYVLKDFIVRSKFMAGFDSPYVPGWDCHGLPIEWKVEQDLRAEKKTKHDVTKAELRKRCRDYAQHWVNEQKKDWQRLLAIGDWDAPYLTMAAPNEAGIVTELGKMVQRGLVYRGLRPTLWSWAEETALAEAEVEYQDETSTFVYVALPLVGRENEHLVIWTTTPWTLPANRAVAVAQAETYAAVEHDHKRYWVAEKLVGDFTKAMGWDAVAVATCGGDKLVGQKVAHPLYDGVSGPVVDGFHVTTDSGTGLVHIAPSHGAEDFTIGMQHKLDVVCPVTGNGTYAADVPALPRTGVPLAGKLIWKAQDEIIGELEASGRLLKKGELKHSYPVSWRSKKKLIYRTTHQWFVDLDKTALPETGKSVRESALDRIHARGVKGVQWVPGYGENRIGAMMAGRPDWCISRQRAWGVPITIMVDKASGEPVKDVAVWDHIAALVAKENIDAWDNRLGGREAELFPDGWLAAQGKTAADFEYATDILDVWFDSGTSHAHVLRADSGKGGRFERHDGKRPADLYQEGSDQHRGWFNSSLLTSVANYGDAPYEAVVTSGFVVDGQGHKFSKSLGNDVKPKELLGKYGMDIIRLWVASSDYSEDIRYSPALMETTSDAYRKFRNVFRWLLGNLNGFDASADTVAYAELPELEQYILHRLAVVLKDARAHMEAYHFHKAYRTVYEFIGGDLSNFYFDVRKDVLYCDAPKAVRRRAVQTVLEQVFRALATHVAPLMPFTAEEVWASRYGANAGSVHLQDFTVADTAWVKDVAFDARWAELLALRGKVNEQAEKLRAAGGLGNNAEAEIGVPVAEADVALMADVAVVSGVRVAAEVGVAKSDAHKCPRCWKYYKVVGQDGLCLRCEEAVA